MTPDPRWLEILKASGWQTAAISLGCGALLWASQAGWLPPFESWLVQLAAAAMVICGLLALASFISNATIQIGLWINSLKKWLALRHSIRTLNTEEIAFVKGQLEKCQTTTQLDPFKAGSIPRFVQQSGMYLGLQDKNIVTVRAADPEGRIQTITIRKAAWKQLKKQFGDQIKRPSLPG
jgi:hypothetical protein